MSTKDESASNLPYVPPSNEAAEAKKPKVVKVDDEEQPLLPLLLQTLRERDLTPADFPEGGRALSDPEQIRLIQLALDLGKTEQAQRLAIPIGFYWRGDTLTRALRKFLRKMRVKLGEEA